MISDNSVIAAAAVVQENSTPLDEIAQITREQKSFFENIFTNLPEKALGLGFRIVLTIIFLLVGRFFINLLMKVIGKAMEKAGIDKGAAQFLESFLRIVLWIVLVMTIAVNNGIDAASAVAILGSAGLAIGLSLQGALSNFAGGLLILVLKPFVIGDYIIENSGRSEGRVTEINVFYTHLLTIDNRKIVVPNGKLADAALINVTSQPKRQLDLRFGISYSADLKKGKEVLEQVARECPYVLDEDAVTVFVSSLDDSAVTLGLRCWVMTADYRPAQWDITERVKLGLDEAGIEIPFRQIDVHIDK